MHLFPSIKLDCENGNNLFGYYGFCLFIHYSPVNRITFKLKRNGLYIANHITIAVFRCVFVFNKWIVNSIKRVFDVWMLCLRASGAQLLFPFPFKATVLTAMGEEAIVATKTTSTRKDWEWGFRGCSWTPGTPAALISGRLSFCSVNEVLRIEPLFLHLAVVTNNLPKIYFRNTW